MSQRELDPRMLDTDTALPAMSGAALTNLPGGGWEFVSSQTASGESTINWTGFVANYDYQIWGYDIIPGTDNQYIYGKYGTGSTPTYQSSGYDFQIFDRYGGTSTSNENTNQSQISICGVYWGNQSNEEGTLMIDIPNPMDSGSRTYIHWRNYYIQGTPTPTISIGGAFRRADDAVSAFQIYPASGNLSGRFYLYKRANTS